MKKKKRQHRSMIFKVLALSLLSVWSCKPKTEIKSDVHEKEEVQEPSFSTSYIMGQFDPADHPDFTIIPSQYTDRDSLYLRKDALEDFIKMYDAALQDNIKLVIRSATRNFDYQKIIWENKWN